ncbi:hypothetical protein DMH01_36625 [Amycolatopsis sp. WAC 04182]|uniref:hypothetical protein n=1 Tax=Amycolatopsis sp. WAC 04182 TaxID=2203198 RepID=UPI000F7BABDC|nr:hypothetical protein [Amycolatopsis sp. WAC 04182]RSN54464.1 hypothetical protein DMH01_36625 [Amycolatopsis sp. WAC 04182]
MINRGCQWAVRTGAERLDQTVLDSVKNDAAAENGRRELEAAFTARRLTTAITSPSAKGWRASFDALPQGKNSGVKTVSTVADLRTLFDHWTAGAQRLPGRGDKIPDVFTLPDGTTMQWRQTSKTGGETIDIFPSGKNALRVHLDG